MNQRERFQAAFIAKWPYRHPNDSTWAEYETFKLGEASGMERAVAVCESGSYEKADECAERIRALMAQGEI